MKKPVTLGCGHSGCENCLSTLASIRAPNCPHCRVPYRSDQLSLNVAMDNVITTLEVRCTNQGCEWKGAYSEAERHYKECPKMEKKCPNEGCSQMVARETIAAHLNSCAKQKIPCQDCRLLVARDRLDRHRASMCGLSVAQCPLCGTQLTRNQINLHQQKCPKKAVECPVTGCRRIMMKEDYSRHISEAAASHYNLQSAEIQRLRRAIHDKKSDSNLTTGKDEKVLSFTWDIRDFPGSLARQRDEKQPLTSDVFLSEGQRWRAVLTEDQRLYLQLISSSHPVTAEIKIVMMPGQEKQKVFCLQQATLSEGEMQGREFKDLNRWVDETGPTSVMAAKESLHLLIFLVLLINKPQVECKIVSNEIPADDREAAVREKRFAVDPLSVIGLVVSVASAIQGAVCTFTDVCGGDEVTKKLEELEKKLDDIKADVTSVRHDVEDIWEESKRKWYFKHIDNIIQQRKEVIQDLKSEDYSQRAKDKQQRFIHEVFGTTSKDEYVEKALYHIPKLVTEERLVTHYFDVQIRNGKSTTEAARLTWIFIRKLFRYQEDGYASVVFAASLKYKNDEASYNSTMSEVCAWWPKSNDPEYEKFCAKFVKDPHAEDRRKPQQDFLFNIRDLALVPVQLVKTDCSKFRDANAIHYNTGFLYVAQPAAKNILVVDPTTLNIVKTLSVPGSECGGSCHPFGVSIKAEHKLLAIGAQSKLSGGESKVMLFKISGNLEEPSGISIEHYYTMLQLLDVGRKKADVRDVAFCGERFGYADYNGVIETWRMPDELYYGWNNGKPEPDLWSRYDWYLRRVWNTYKDHQYYLGCSNSGRDWVVEKTNRATVGDGVGAVPSDSSARNVNEILDIAEIKVLYAEWGLRDGRSRMNKLKGIAMDSKRNLFYSSGGKVFYNSVCGVYQRTYDGKRRFIREWNKGCDIQMFGMAVDEKGFLFSLQNHESSRKCLYKFHHEIDLEDINAN